MDLGEFLCIARYTGWVGLSKSAMSNCKNQSVATRLISHHNYKEFICILVSSLPHSFVKSVKATNRLTIFECTSRTQVCKVRDRKYFPPSRMCEIFQTHLKASDLPWPPWPLKVQKKCPGYNPIRSPIVTFVASVVRRLRPPKQAALFQRFCATWLVSMNPRSNLIYPDQIIITYLCFGKLQSFRF